MNEITMTRRAGVLATAVAAALVGLGIGAAPIANAADDCGLGYHLAGDTCIAQPWLAQECGTCRPRAIRNRWDAGSIRSASSTATPDAVSRVGRPPPRRPPAARSAPPHP